jgi:hypothetical protein
MKILVADDSAILSERIVSALTELGRVGIAGEATANNGHGDSGTAQESLAFGGRWNKSDSAGN